MKRSITALIAATALTAAASVQATEPYTAEYKVRASIASGTSVQRLRVEPDGSYIFTVETEPTGFAGLFVSGKAEEMSIFRIEDDGAIRPLEYRSIDELDDDGKYGKVVFDWENETVSSTWKGERKDFVLSEGMLDTGSLQIALMDRAAQGIEQTRFEVVHKNRLKEYVFSRIDEETVNTGAGEYETVVYERQRPGSDRVTRLWLAPELDHLPVKMVQYRRGKKHMSLILEAYREG